MGVGGIGERSGGGYEKKRYIGNDDLVLDKQHVHLWGGYQAGRFITNTARVTLQGHYPFKVFTVRPQ